MKALHSTKKLVSLALALSLATAITQAQTSGSGPFGVTSPGFFYQIDGLAGQNPSLTLQAGVTYIFNLNTDGIHPVVIATNNTAFPPVNSAYVGASPQNRNTGSITLTIPAI